MIRSTKVSLKFINTSKRKQLNLFINEYRLVVSKFTDILWPLDKVPILLPKPITSKITTWLSTRALQCAGKQASAIVRGTRKKQSQRLYIYNKLNIEGKHKQARKLKKIIDTINITKPNISQVCPELDARFIKQDWNNPTSFDGIITLTSLGNKLKLTLPVKKSRHFNKLLLQGTIKQGIRLSRENITFNFDIEDISLKTTGTTIGLDIGIINTFTLSSGLASQPCNHGHTLSTINKTLVNKTKGSKAFTKTQQHRTNYINWSLNQIDFTNVKTLRIENIKNLRKYKRTSKYLSHFTYTELYNKLQDLTTTNGVRLEKVNPTYTSQKCNNCGWVRSNNRKGKQFKCGACKYECDSDYNAALNIATILPSIKKAERLKHKNRKGFYWNPVSRGKHIVSPTPKPV